MTDEPLFQSFLMGGSSARPIAAIRETLDMIAATLHDRFIAQDYARLIEYGMRTARDGIRWHLIEERPVATTFRASRQ